MFLSETYSLTDCYKFDKGILDDPQTRDVWTKLRATMTRENEYTSVVGTSDVSGGMLYIKIPNGEWIIEVDHYVSVANTNLLNIRNSNYTIISSPYNFNIITDEWVHWIVRITNDKIYFTDSNGQTTNTSNNSGLYFTMRCLSNEPVRFKNFEMYPI